MRRSVTIMVAMAVLVAATLWFTLRTRPATVPRTAIAYDPERVIGSPSGSPTAALPAPPASQIVRTPSELDRALGPPRWHPRPDGEWDGMRVNLNVQPPCDGPDLCGLARACKGGRCGPCEVDVECASGESCVLDHCVRSANVSCRRRADCGPRSSCILSGYSAGVRGNEDMRAYCVAEASGADRPPRASPSAPPAKDPRSQLPGDDLMRTADSARRQ